MAFPKARRPKQSPKKRNKIQALFWLDPAQAKLLKRTAVRLKVSQSELARAAFAYIESHGLWGEAADAAAAVNTAAAAASEAA